MPLIIVFVTYYLLRIALELTRFSVGTALDTATVPDAYGFIGCISVVCAVASFLVTRDKSRPRRTFLLVIIGIIMGISLDLVWPIMPFTLIAYFGWMSIPALALACLTGLAVGWMAGNTIQDRIWLFPVLIVVWAILSMWLLIAPADGYFGRVFG